MTTARAARKHTAANTPALARVKRAMNGPIFRLVLDTYNAAGADAARARLGVYFNDEARERCLGRIFDGIDA
jgi:hypothetical protein